VGLGNPGKEYENNRHNIGFVILKELCKKIEAEKFVKKRSYFILHKNRWLFLLPRTYMNLSGIAVQKVVRKYKIDLNNLMVLLDDVNLPIGKIRIRAKGSDGGHNGLRSVIAELGSQDFPRLRIGIGPNISKDMPDAEIPLREFVLSDFTEGEKEILEKAVPQAVELLTHFLFHDYQKMSDVFSNILDEKEYNEKKV
jgi:PTH1 family peptidyl-tRNA hydrolase